MDSLRLIDVLDALGTAADRMDFENIANWSNDHPDWLELPEAPTLTDTLKAMLVHLASYFEPILRELAIRRLMEKTPGLEARFSSAR